MGCVIVCCWLLAAFLFSLPYREAPTEAKGLDFLALGKLISRAASLPVFVLVGLMHLRKNSLKESFFAFFGFALFFMWASLSVTWSALPSVSAGQVFTFAVMLSMTFAISQMINKIEDARLILLSLNLLVLGRSIFMIFLYFVFGPYSISREVDSFIHSTEAAATAGPGIILLVANVACFRGRFNELLLVVGVVLHAIVFLIAQNRLSLIITPSVIVMILVMTGNLRSIVGLVFFGCIAIPMYLLFDPGLEMLSKFIGSTEEYAARSGDSDKALVTLSGRTEMWGVIWEEYLASPLRGHGFFVTSSTGEIDVWDKVRNYTAHNLLLQVLSTTGAIGLFLFCAAFWMPFKWLLSGLAAQGERGMLAKTCFFIVVYICLWSFLNSAFMGALGTASIIAFTILGVVIGGLRPSVWRDETSQRDA